MVSIRKRGVPQESGVSDELIKSSMQALPEELQKSAVMVSFRHNDIVIRKGEPTQYAYLLLAGDLIILNELQDGNYYSFAHIRPGRYVSDLEVLSGKMTNAVSVLALENSVALRFDLDNFINCLNTDIVFLKSIVHGLAAAMFETSYERGRGIYELGINKLMYYIVRYCAYAKPSLPQQSVTVKATRQHIASEIGTTEKTVNRSVSSLKAQGLIGVLRGKITVSPQQLKELSLRIGDIQ